MQGAYKGYIKGIYICNCYINYRVHTYICITGYTYICRKTYGEGMKVTGHMQVKTYMQCIYLYYRVYVEGIYIYYRVYISDIYITGYMQKVCSYMQCIYM